MPALKEIERSCFRTEHDCNATARPDFTRVECSTCAWIVLATRAASTSNLQLQNYSMQDVTSVGKLFQITQSLPGMAADYGSVV